MKDKTGINSSKETSFAEKYLKEAENHEMTDEDTELAENHAKMFEHNSLITYSNIQLDFIKIFEEKIFVMIIGKPVKNFNFI